MINNQLPTDYQNFIALSRYARWKEDEQRRETWSETVARYFDYLTGHLLTKHNYKLADELRAELETAVLDQHIMPSMRALMTAGPALDRCHVGGYNCSYVPVDNPRAFDETMYILMCGTGVGFSVERHHIEKLPIVNEDMHVTDTVIKVGDSRPGWAKSLRELISLLYAGQIPLWDVSEVRPAGARLKTFGGRASGPAPLEELFEFIIEKFKGAKGRRLYPIECHDIMCKIGEVVVVGGVRRSALISHRWVHSCVNGYHCTRVSQVSVVSSTVSLHRSKQPRMVVEMRNKILDVTPVVKLYYVHISSVICLRLLYVKQTRNKH